MVSFSLRESYIQIFLVLRFDPCTSSFIFSQYDNFLNFSPCSHPLSHDKVSELIINDRRNMYISAEIDLNVEQQNKYIAYQRKEHN